MNEQLGMLYNSLLFNVDTPSSFQIGQRGSRVRSEVLGIVRGQVASFYGFNLNTTPKANDHNRTLSAKLLSGSVFHYKVGHNFTLSHLSDCFLRTRMRKPATRKAG